MKKPLFANEAVKPKTTNEPRYETRDYLTPGAVQRLQDMGEAEALGLLAGTEVIPMADVGDPLAILIALEEYEADPADFLG